MNCFIMKARTLDGTWFPFTMQDVPTRFNNNEFALMQRPNTPRLLLQNIRRGDEFSGTYEGDIIKAENQLWLVCYERGFYAINTDHVTRHLHTFDSFEIVDNCFNSEFPIPILMRNKHLFKYKDVVFRFEDIVGSYDANHVILRSCSDPVPSSDIQQDCGISIQGVRAYLGDLFDGRRVCLHKGRIAYADGDCFVDVTTGGSL